VYQQLRRQLLARATLLLLLLQLRPAYSCAPDDTDRVLAGSHQAVRH
jgi:hypothetical protein